LGWHARVLVVEDHEDVAESMKLLLELLGHEACVAHDGVAACDVAAAERPDVMFVAIGLAGMDGYEVSRAPH
jgi:CheY-like chemotaxis protein